jgi:cytochrome c-type biogenesis protein CcmH
MLKYILVVCLLAGPAFAVEPDELLDDPVMEARARHISKDLRCLVCRNENIDSSNAGIARDLRLLVRERLVAGDSNQDAIGFIVDRYGEFVLLRPARSLSNLTLWASGPVLFLIGGAAALVYIRRRRPVHQQSLSEQEKQRLQEIMDS